MTTLDPEIPAKSARSRSTTAIKWAVAIVVLTFVTLAVRRQLGDADFSGLTVRPMWLVAAVLSLPQMYFAIALSERSLVDTLAQKRLTLAELLPAAWIPMLGKFVPGKVAAAGTAVVLLKRLGVPATTAVGVFLLLDAMPLMTGTLLGGGLLVDPALREQFPAAPWLLVGLIVVGLVALSPPVFSRLANGTLRLLRRPPLPRVPGPRDYVVPLVMSLVQWLFNGLAVWCAAMAFLPEADIAALPQTICVTALVMCLSYFGALVTPSGLGVREGVFIPLLTLLVGLPAATATAVFMRLNHTMVELVLSSIGLVMLRGSLVETQRHKEAKDRKAEDEVDREKASPSL